VKLKTLGKPVVPLSRLPPEFAFARRQLQKAKSVGEKLTFNDFVDFARKDQDDTKQGKLEYHSKQMSLKQRVEDIVYANMLDENDPDLYETLVLQTQKQQMLRKLQQNASKFESTSRHIEQETKLSLNSSRQSFFDYA
jgi:hypothetical protein